MHPILFEIGNWPVYSYGVLLALAYLAGLQLAVVRARRRQIDAARVMDLGIYLIIAALIGAKLMLVAVDFDYFRSQPRELLSLVRAGGVFYGGLLAALAVGLWLVGRYKLDARLGLNLGSEVRTLTNPRFTGRISGMTDDLVELIRRLVALPIKIGLPEESKDFAADAATLAVLPSIPVAGMAIILGVDRFLSECRALTNFIGNAVATIVVSRWEGALDRDKLKLAMAGKAPPLAARSIEQDPD